MERIVPATGFIAHGHHLPGGTIVSVPQYAVHRDTEVFGEDAECFRAERWLEASESTLRKMERNFLAVSYSRFECVR